MVILDTTLCYIENNDVGILMIVTTGILVSTLAGSVLYMIFLYWPVYNITLDQDCYIIQGHILTGPGCDYNGYNKTRGGLN